MTKLSEHYFGDLESFDEAQTNAEFFNQTYVAPSSLSTELLRNNRKFIIIGRKGVGKTAVQMRLANELESKGYLTHHFRFMYDLRSDDYAEISRTQSDISYTNISNERNIFLHYEFRDVWERVLLRRVGEKLRVENFVNSFVDWTAPKSSALKSIFGGISKSLSVKVEAPIGPISAALNLDLSSLLSSNSEIPLKQHNLISRSLLKNSCTQFQFYFFIDELVFSRIDAKPDEVTIRAAMVRDLLRTAWELNTFCAKENLSFHFVCSLRPEVRNLINDLDSESGKFLDGKDVELTWFAKDGSQLLVESVLEMKVRYSHYSQPDPRSFFAQRISFKNNSIPIIEFLKRNTWGRPRDIVRLLNSIQKKSPNASCMHEDEIKLALDDYSRSSLKELGDELGVKYGQKIVSALKESLKKKIYRDRDEILTALTRKIVDIDENLLVAELFNAGVIGGCEPDKGNFYWAHRGETYLKSHHQIMVHPGLWNELSIRGS